jgi:hypothetical protein
MSSIKPSKLVTVSVLDEFSYFDKAIKDLLLSKEQDDENSEICLNEMEEDRLLKQSTIILTQFNFNIATQLLGALFDCYISDIRFLKGLTTENEKVTGSRYHKQIQDLSHSLRVKYDFSDAEIGDLLTNLEASILANVGEILSREKGSEANMFNYNFNSDNYTVSIFIHD